MYVVSKRKIIRVSIESLRCGPDPTWAIAVFNMVVTRCKLLRAQTSTQPADGGRGFVAGKRVSFRKWHCKGCCLNVRLQWRHLPGRQAVIGHRCFMGRWLAAYDKQLAHRQFLLWSLVVPGHESPRVGNVGQMRWDVNHCGVAIHRATQLMVVDYYLLLQRSSEAWRTAEATCEDWRIHRMFCSKP